jgi:hypothetical protein
MGYKYENCNLEIVWYIPVIPAPYQVRDKLQQESRRRPCESRDLSGSGFPFARE